MNDPRADKIPLIALGAGPYTATLLDTFDAHAGELPFRLAGFAQNLDPARRGDTIDGLPIYTMEELPQFASTHQALCILGDPEGKRRFVEAVESMGFEFATLIHPTARHSPRCTIGPGGYVGLQAITFRNARIGRHCTVLGQAIVGDENVIGDYSFIATAAKLSGGVTVGADSFIGVGAIVTERITIGANAIVGAGAVVIRDVPDNVAVVGNPAREIPRNRPLRPNLPGA